MFPVTAVYDLGSHVTPGFNIISALELELNLYLIKLPSSPSEDL